MQARVFERDRGEIKRASTCCIVWWEETNAGICGNTLFVSVYLFSGPSIYTEPTSTKPLHIHHVAPHRSYRADLKTQREIIPLPSACSRPGPNSGLYQTCALSSYLVTMTWGEQFGASLGNSSSLICRKPMKFSQTIPEVKELSNNIQHVFL